MSSSPMHGRCILSSQPQYIYLPYLQVIGGREITTACLGIRQAIFRHRRRFTTYARRYTPFICQAWGDHSRVLLISGKALLRSLTTASIPCTYLLLPSLPSVLPHTTTLFVGAHSLHANGAVFSRAGTAMVAMMAKSRNIPVVVCCETYKFAEGIRWDGVSKNELGECPRTMLRGLLRQVCVCTAPTPFPPSSTLDSDPHSLKSRANLSILSPLYDLTPPSCITAVVTEVGIIPPSSISSIPGALGRVTIGA